MQAACSPADLSPTTPSLHPPPCPPFRRGGQNTGQMMVTSTIITASLGNPHGYAPWRNPLLPVPILPATRLPYRRFVTCCHVMSDDDVECHVCSELHRSVADICTDYHSSIHSFLSLLSLPTLLPLLLVPSFPPSLPPPLLLFLALSSLVSVSLAFHLTFAVCSVDTI